MNVKAIAAKRPDILLELSFDEAETLLNFLREAASYACDCGENTDYHDSWINAIGYVLKEHQ